jgi:hypothetical protein
VTVDPVDAVTLLRVVVVATTAIFVLGLAVNVAVFVVSCDFTVHDIKSDQRI